LSTPTIEALLIDDENEDKCWSHGIGAWQVLQLLEGVHTIRRNRKNRRAQYLLVGRDRQGFCIAVPIEATHDERTWRPITAWYCKPHESAWLT
jgi:hypothetical protein